MKRSIKIWMILLGASCIAAISPAQEPNHDSQAVNEVRSRENSRFDAIQREDSATLDAIFDDALLRVDQEGLLWTKADYMANLHNPNSQVLQVVPGAMTMQVFGDVVIVVGIYVERGVKSGHPYIHRCRFIDTWELKKGKWVCIASAATSIPS